MDFFISKGQFSDIKKYKINSKTAHEPPFNYLFNLFDVKKKVAFSISKNISYHKKLFIYIKKIKNQNSGLNSLVLQLTHSSMYPGTR